MGLQQVQDVTLIRHAYVRSGSQKRGIGSQLLSHLRELTNDPVLIGTWAMPFGRYAFMKGMAFAWLAPRKKIGYLKNIGVFPERQVETSVVLADAKWWEANGWCRSKSCVTRPRHETRCATRSVGR